MTGKAVDLESFDKKEDTDEASEQDKFIQSAGLVDTQTILPPARISFISDTADFVTTEIESIRYSQIGCYAEGSYEGSDAKENVLLFWADIRAISFDFEAAKEQLTALGDELE